jgi:hypothetical protein
VARRASSLDKGGSLDEKLAPMLRLAITAVCLSGCIAIATPSSFRHSLPTESAVVFGRFLVDGKPLREMRLGRFGDVIFETGTNALIDAAGNFAFVVEPGAYYLHWYEPAGERTRIFDSRAPPDPVFHFEVRAGELHWLGAWEEAAKSNRDVELRRLDSVQPPDVLRRLVAIAAGTRWEATLASEVERLAPTPLPP